ncbi:BA75_03477T0 [Komagataella pastoris]|uniref:Glycylpeptide N-tetradecanoyltransferase n=1 Tax=Komagataella pastoris TaxID=4922 RepID=A0A1B2JEI0_PICPA|nr:BA75_03477T0 [Komagataella pastoris]
MSDDKKESLQKLQQLLQSLQVGQQVSETSSLPPKKKDEYKFWKTQPVASFEEKIQSEGPIDERKTPDDIADSPLPLLSSFEWVNVDMEDDHQADQLYDLLCNHYVEDKDSSLRFQYSQKFLKWALKSPRWKKDWHVGVRVKESGKLVAFISAIPVNLSVREKKIESVEINFLCVHKQLRSKRLAPILIKEITRRVNKCDIWHALYSGGGVIPTPVSTCRYTHRPLNFGKLYECGFSGLPHNTTKEQMIARYTIGSSTKLTGLRSLESKDLDQVKTLFDTFQSKYELYQNFTTEELEHWLLGDKEQQNLENQNDKVIQSFVVENDSGEITDFVSFYILPFGVLQDNVHKTVNVAYLFYYATTAGLKEPSDDIEATKVLKHRLIELVGDVLVLAKQLGIDVLNALTSQDNTLFLQDLKFGLGDGYLHFYLFNYRAFPIDGGIDKETGKFDEIKRSKVGVVML